MSNKHQKAMGAINDLYGDTSVPISTTREKLEELLVHIEELLDTLPESEG